MSGPFGSSSFNHLISSGFYNGVATQSLRFEDGSSHKLSRTFSSDVAEEELVWHRDRTNRRIHILGGQGWQLQFDDKLPEELMIGSDYYIQKMTYHRVIKGENDLIIRIENI